MRCMKEYGGLRVAKFMIFGKWPPDRAGQPNGLKTVHDSGISREGTRSLDLRLIHFSSPSWLRGFV